MAAVDWICIECNHTMDDHETSIEDSYGNERIGYAECHVEDCECEQFEADPKLVAELEDEGRRDEAADREFDLRREERLLGYD